MSSDRKRFHRGDEEIRRLVPECGYCLATDHILVEGRKVGHMWREEPASEIDSGWRFFSGFEPEDYLDDPENADIYSVNTIANYDPDIIPFVGSPVGSEFVRDEISGAFVSIAEPAENERFPPHATNAGLNPNFPAVSGQHALQGGWSITLPLIMNRRRTEDDRFVFWRPGLTVYLDVVRMEWGSPREKLIRMEGIMPADAFSIEELWEERLARLGYRVNALYREGDDVRPLHEFQGAVFSRSGYAELTIYFDDEADFATVRETWLGVTQDEPG